MCDYYVILLPNASEIRPVQFETRHPGDSPSTKKTAGSMTRKVENRRSSKKVHSPRVPRHDSARGRDAAITIYKYMEPVS